MLETIVFYMMFVFVILGALITTFGSPKNIKLVKLRFRLHSTVFFLFFFYVILQVDEEPIEFIVGCIILFIILLQSLIRTLFNIIKAYATGQTETTENNK